MKKLTFIRLGLLATALFLVGGFFITNSEAAITSTFVASETVANLPAVNDQDAVTATTVPNVTAGVNDQTAATATTVANANASSATATVDSNIVVTADVAGSTGNALSIEIVQSTSNMGASTNATIVITKTGSAILATVAHNSHPNADGSNPIDVTRASVVQALNMSISGAVQGGFVTVTITNDVTADITASGGGASKVGTVGATSLAGGSDAVAQVNTVTITGTPEEGDVFTVNLPVAGDVNYTVQLADTTNDLIAAGLNTAIQASSGYGTQVTSSVLTNVITITAVTPGVGFTQTSSAVDKATAQVNTITISGTVEEGDVFTATLPVDGPVNYTVLAGDTTNDNIATGINSAIQASPGYAGQDFTSGVAGNVITLTAKVAGTGFIQTSGTTNRTAIAQVVTFTPASVSVGETFRATIDGTDYDYLAASGNGIAEVVTALAPLMDANASVGCTEDDLKVTCTASTAGTSFTYGATVVDITAPVISSLSFTPATGTAKIGDVITLNITSDQIGYSAGAITVNGEAVAGFTDLGAGLYSVTYAVAAGNTDRTSGTVPASVVLDDGDGNSNTAYTTVTANTLAIDANAPTLVSAQTTSTTTIDLTFSEDLNGSTITNADFAVAGYTLGTDAFEFAPGVVRLTVSPAFATSDTPDVDYTGSVTDLAGNPAPTILAVNPADGVAPVLAEVTPVPTPDNDDTPSYTFSSGEAGDITVGGDCSMGALAAIVGSNTITFNTIADGVHSNCTVTVTDSSTNASLPLAVSSFIVDTVPPDVTISSLAPDPTNTSPVSFTATFTEDVTGFTGADIDLVNGILSSFVPVSGSVYNFGVVPVIQGLMTVDIDANSGMDAAGNNNTAASQLTRVYDSVPPVITMLGASPVNIEYGETYVDDGATAFDPISGSSGDGDITGSIVTVDPVNTSVLGTYTVTYNVTDSAGNVATEVTRTVNVVQRAITVTAVTDTKEYDDSNSSSGTPTITSGSLAGGDSVTWTQTYDNKNVGTGKTLTPAGTVSDGNGGNNYAVTFVNDVTGEITVKNITVTADPQSKTYGDPDPVLTHDGVLLGADVFSGSLTRDAGEDVGTYAINQGTLDAGTNYNITFVSDDLTINQKDITVTADPQSKTYGDADPALTYTNDPLVGTDTFSGSLDRDPGEDVGTYAINQGTLDAGTNYNITFVSDDLTIIPKNITVTADPQSKVYGDADPTLTYTNDPLVGADTFSGSLDRASGEDVGTYAIDQGTLDAGANYNINFVSDDLTITPLAITGEFTADNKVYDGNTSATISGRSLTGVLGGDDVDYDGGTATFDTKNVGTGKTVSGTGFSLTGADAGNYTVNSSAATTADITTRALTVTPSASNKVYDGNTTASVILSDDKIGGDDVVVTNTGATFADKNVGAGKTVTTSFTVTGTDAGNYTATASPVMTTADITAKDLTVTAFGIDKTFDNTTNATVTLSDDRVLGDVFTATYVSASFADSSVGVDKDVSVLGIAISGTDAGNYNLLNTTANTTADINSPSSSGGSSGSRRATPATPAVPGVSPAIPAVPGQVLGAERFVFTLFLKMGPPYGAGVQNEVMELQKYLNTLGYECGLADGKFGPKTKACVVKFQLANGLKGDGIVGPLTRAVLNK